MLANFSSGSIISDVGLLLLRESGYCIGARVIWKTSQRVIAKIEHHEQGSNRRFSVTNQENDLPAENVYDQEYCLRGDMENKIKQLKLDLSSGRNSCSDFLANQCRVLLSSIAYVLMTELQYQALSETELEKSYCVTIRLKLFKIGAIFFKNTRRN